MTRAIGRRFIVYSRRSRFPSYSVLFFFFYRDLRSMSEKDEIPETKGLNAKLVVLLQTLISNMILRATCTNKIVRDRFFGQIAIDCSLAGMPRHY